MNDRVTDLAFEFADETARSDIECMCLLTREDGKAPETPEQLKACWYDVANFHDEEHEPYVTRALEYLELRGMLKRHPTNIDWVQVKDEPTIARPV